MWSLLISNHYFLFLLLLQLGRFEKYITYLIIFSVLVNGLAEKFSESFTCLLSTNHPTITFIYTLSTSFNHFLPFSLSFNFNLRFLFASNGSHDHIIIFSFSHNLCTFQQRKKKIKFVKIR